MRCGCSQSCARPRAHTHPTPPSYQVHLPWPAPRNRAPTNTLGRGLSTGGCDITSERGTEVPDRTRLELHSPPQTLSVASTPPCARPRAPPGPRQAPPHSVRHGRPHHRPRGPRHPPHPQAPHPPSPHTPRQFHPARCRRHGGGLARRPDHPPRRHGGAARGQACNTSQAVSRATHGRRETPTHRRSETAACGCRAD